MKKLISIALISIMVLALVAAPISANKGNSFAAEYGTPKMDGKVDDVWNNCATEAVVNMPHNGDNKGSTDTASVKAMWDETHLYFLVTAKDSQLADGECFEFYIDEAFDKSEKFNKNDRQSRIYVQTGEILDSTKDEDGNDTSRKELYDSKTGWGFSKTADGWVCEVAFKWAGNVTIKAGMDIGVEFMWDDQGAGLALRWNVDTANGDGAPYQSTKDFGKLTLNEEVVAEEETEAAAETPKTDAPKTDSTTSAATADPITAAIIVVALLGTGVVIGKTRK